MLKKIAVLAVSTVLCTGCLVSAESIFYSTGSVNPGETAMICGSGLSGITSVSVSRLEDGAGNVPAFVDKALPDRPNTATDGAAAPIFNSDNSVNTAVIQPSDTSIKFEIPEDLGFGVYSVKAGNKTVYINCPFVTWTMGDMGDYATPGGTLRVFGENITADDFSRAVLVNENGNVTELNLKKVYDKYSAEFSLGSISCGEYKLFVHNGYGDNTSWSVPVDVTVNNKPAKKTTEFNIKDYGAKGNGKYDDSNAFERAIAAAGKNGGGVVYIPRGRYILTRNFIVPENITIRGEDKNLCSLIWLAYSWDIGKLPDGFLRVGKNFTMENLTLNGSRAKCFVKSDTAIKGTRDIIIRNVNVFANPFSGKIAASKSSLIVDEMCSSRWFAFNLGGTNVEISGCEIYAPSGALSITDGKYVKVYNNKIYNGYAGWYGIGGCSGTVLEDNYITTSSQNGTGGAFHNIGYNRTENVYCARNAMEKIVGNDREVMTTDGGNGCYVGSVSIDGTTLTVLDSDGYASGYSNLLSTIGMGVFVIDGTGAGQYRIIQGIEGNDTVILENPFEINPDEDSFVCILPVNRRGIYTDIDVTDGGAFQFYGMAIENIVDNIILNRSAGINIWALYTYRAYRPCWYNTLINTSIENGDYIHWFGAEDSWSGNSAVRITASGKGQMNIGTVVRNTNILNCGEILLKSQKDTVLRDVIIENTNINLSDNGIIMSAEEDNSSIDGVYIKGFNTEEVTNPLTVSGECNYITAS